MLGSRNGVAIVLILALGACASGQVTSPEAHLGRPVGVDFDLADWDEVAGYYRKLGDESPRVITRSVGKTTEGREFLISIISSPENLARLDAIRESASRLADPRGSSDAEIEEALDEGRLILFVSCAMHATEAAGAQFGMEFAHALATSEEEPWRSARENVVVVVYTTNPDGVDHVTNWYRENVGTPHEATGLLELYQHYAGHDNNRDWFMLTQAETQIVTRLLYSEWFPQVYWDVHQQGSSRERFFVPPFRDPLNPNLDPAIITGIDALGSRALMDLTREGFTGVSTGVSYDMWWNGGNRNVPVRHNVIGLLTEAASVRIASPVFLSINDLRPPRGLDGYAPSNQFPDPWPGGWWRLRNIIDYEMAFGRSLLGSLSRERRYWLGNSLEASRRTIQRGLDEAPRGWLIPSDNRDPDAVRRLADVLLQSGVELHVTDEPVAADGRTYPAGTIAIRRAQPYGSHVKDLFDVQRYPDGQPPYDVAGWTLPLLLGVRRIEVMEEPAWTGRRVTTPDDATAGFAGDQRVADERVGPDVLSIRHSDTWTRLSRALGEGRPVTYSTTGDTAGLFRLDDDTVDDNEYALTRQPRIGVYAPWSPSMDEGWTRYVLDTYEIPYVRVRNEMVRAGALGDFLDVLIIPSISGGSIDRGRKPGSVADPFAGGLAPEGAVAVEEFVRAGGTLISLGASSGWTIDLFEIPIVDVTRETGSGFSCPGSVLRAVPDDGGLMSSDLPDSVAVFFSASAAFREMTEAERKTAAREDEWTVDNPLRYAPSRVLLSGWIKNPEVIEGRAAWLRIHYGRGRVHLFGFRPQYRGWAQSTFGLLFRALYFDGQRRDEG